MWNVIMESELHMFYCLICCCLMFLSECISEWWCNDRLSPAEGALNRCLSSETVRSDPSEILQQEWRSRPVPDPCCTALESPDAFFWYTHTHHSCQKTSELFKRQEKSTTCDNSYIPVVAEYNDEEQKQTADANRDQKSQIMNAAVQICGGDGENTPVFRQQSVAQKPEVLSVWVCLVCVCIDN